MKKTLLIALIVAVATTVLWKLNANAQDSPTPLRTEEYCEIVGSTQMFSTKLVIAVDYGQERKFFQDNRTKDAEGSVKKFNSMIDALNYMAEQGWTYVSAYPVTMSNQNVYHYVMKRAVAPKQ